MTDRETLKLARDWIAERPADRPVSAGKMISIIDRALAQPDAFEQGRQEGMKQERALWELSRVGQEIEAQPKVCKANQQCLSGLPCVCQPAQETKIGCVQHDCDECVTRMARQDAHESMMEAASQQRQWVGLTEDEMSDIVEDCDGVGWDVAPQIEAKLKEKNT
jgi:hypothetical protein